MEAVYKDDDIQLYQGDCLKVLPQLPDNSINCCVTSPPYFRLRQYLFDGAVVLKADIKYGDKLKIIRELKSRGVLPRNAP